MKSLHENTLSRVTKTEELKEFSCKILPNYTNTQAFLNGPIGLLILGSKVGQYLKSPSHFKPI